MSDDDWEAVGDAVIGGDDSAPRATFDDEYDGGWEDLASAVPSADAPGSKPKDESKAAVFKAPAISRKKQKADAIARKDREAEAMNMSAEDIRRQREEDELRKRESDRENADALFAGLDSLTVPRQTVVTVSAFEFTPTKGKQDFTAFAKKISSTVEPYADSQKDNYNHFMVEMAKNLASNEEVSGDDIRKVVAALNLVINDKIKAQKSAAGKKAKPQAKKPTATKAAVFEDMGGGGGGGYDDGDDFM